MTGGTVPDSGANDEFLRVKFRLCWEGNDLPLTPDAGKSLRTL
jgi:hypothetical protein